MIAANKPSHDSEAAVCCLHHLFEAAVRSCPDGVAVIADGVEVRYRDLDGRADRLCHLLRRSGVRAESTVAICCERSLDMVVAVLGVLKAGGAYVGLDPELPTARLELMLEDSKPMALITQEHTRHRLHGFRGATICIDLEEGVIDGEMPPFMPPVSVSAGNLAYLVYTSGSTGRPKAVIGTHGSAASYLRFIVHAYGLRAGDRVLQLASLSFDAAVRDLLGPLAAGASLVLMEPGKAKDPVALISAIEEHQVTCLLSIVPSMFRILLATSCASISRTAPTLRLVLVSGERFFVADALRARRALGPALEIVNQYGPTECTMTSSFYRVTEADDHVPEAPIGGPVPGCRLSVLVDWQPVRLGVPGELYIGGTGVSRGYYGHPDLTAERFLPDPFAPSPGERMYATGDLVCCLPNGALSFLGRIDAQVKLHGHRIEPIEVEMELCRHPSVLQAAVAVREDRLGDQRLVAYVVPRAGEPPVAELRESLEQKLPACMVPTIFVTLAKLPVTANGKLDRHSLPAPEETVEKICTASAMPRSPLEQQVAQIWQEVLGVAPIGVHDGFFDLGGDSILAMLLMARIQERFGKALPQDELFQNGTIAGLAKALDTGTSSPSLVKPLRVAGKHPPFFLMHPAGGTVFRYEQLLHHMDPEQPVFGLQARGVDDDGDPCMRVDEMAQLYLDAIFAVQRRGPYRLAGWSFGGYVAFEMACRLERQGEKVDVLALIDTHAPGYRREREDGEVRNLVRLGQRLGLDLIAQELRDLGPEQLLPHVAKMAEKVGLPAREHALKSVARLMQVYRSNTKAAQEYIPSGTYSGRINLLSAAEGLPAAEARPVSDVAGQGWNRFTAKQVEVQVVPGKHSTIIDGPQAAYVAEVLNQILADTRGGP